MTEKDLKIINSLLERTENLRENPHLITIPINYKLSNEDKNLLKDTFQKFDDILNEIQTFINLKFPERQDYIQSWNDIQFNTKIFEERINTADKEYMKSEWKKGILDLENLIKSLIKEVEFGLLLESQLVNSLQKKKTSSTESKNYLKEIIIGIIVVVVGGLILNLILNTKENFQAKKHDAKVDLKKPSVSIENYKLKALNETAKNLDTVSIKFKYQGSKISLNSNFKLIDYNFYEKKYFYLGNRNEYNPELELIEVMIANPILDSLNRESNIKIELKRKLIFDGQRMAYFEENDKEQIGNFRLSFNYKYEDIVIRDTLISGIYIVK